MKHKFFNVSAVGLLLLLSLLALCQSCPYFQKVPLTDSGLFMYGGMMILSGGLPYRDIFEHKPPGVFYIDALGLLLGGGSRWGVWVIELLSLCTAAMLSYFLLKKIWDVLPAFFGTVMWLIASFVFIDFGNSTEAYALPLQFGAMFLFYSLEKDKKYGWRWFLIGLVGGAAFMIKQPLIGLWIAICIYLVITRLKDKNTKNLKYTLLPLIAGVIGFTGLIFIFFAVQGAFGYFWETAFLFNVAYSKTTFTARFLAFLYGLREILPTSVIVIITYFFTLFILKNSVLINENIKIILNLALIDLPVEFILAGLAGRPYRHYYIPWLVPFSVFLGFFCYVTLDKISMIGLKGKEKNKKALWGYAAVAFLIIITAVTLPGPVALLYERTYGVKDDGRGAIISFIKENTSKNDKIVIWGTEPAINVLSGRLSPTRLVMVYHMFLPNNPRKVAMAEEFLKDLKNKKPVFIIDASLTSELMVPPILPNLRAQWEYCRRSYYHEYVPIPQYNEIYNYILSNYEPVGTFPVFAPYCTNENKLVWILFRQKKVKLSKGFSGWKAVRVKKM